MISGSTGAVASLSWMEPFRPYLIVLTVLVLGFAWYQKLKPKKSIDCDCATDKPSFFQSKKFLALTTVFAIGMTFFPYLSSVFYADSSEKGIGVEQKNIKTVNFDVEGMTCAACEKHITHAVNKLNGIVTSAEEEKVEIQFDKSKVDKVDLITAINNTGYTIKK